MRNVRFGATPAVACMSETVKVFGCRQAYENRPSTNPRAARAGLWGFLVLPGGGDGRADVVMVSAAAWRARFFVGRAVNRQIATADGQPFRPDFGQGRASRH